MSIKNEKSITEEKVETWRDLIEHRATWFYYFLDEAKKAGLTEDFAREAIRKCGVLHGNTKFVRTDSLKEFADSFCSEQDKKIFEMEAQVSEDKVIVDFHYCPLVAAWQKLTDNEKLIDEMCDMAMDGDRGIVSTYDNFKLDLQETIAKGDGRCRLVFTKEDKK